MGFSINTNIASLQAQNYLRQTETFQNQTINQVTSGLRIVNSGDDAAGLAIANNDRSNEAVLTQGIQNANNGLSQLQIADGGLSNISQLLDSARTLATESASGSFTGNRAVLNSSFQSIIQEVNRQAQAIGLNQGGAFAANLSVFVGGGQASGGVSAASNGSVSVNLSQATVDAKSLGLEGVQATGVANTDIGTGSADSVSNILANTANQGTISNNTTTFSFTGPGFSSTSGSNVLKVAVNLTGVTDSNTLVTAINQAITNAGNGSSQQATAFQNANITAAVNTDASGKQQLSFNSASTAFQVQGDDQVATAVMGNFQTVGGGVVAGTGAVATSQTASTAFGTSAASENVQLRISGDGLLGAPANDLSVGLVAADTATTAAAKINTAIAANATVAATGIHAVVTNGGANIQFQGPGGSSFQVQAAGDTNNALGLGSFASSAGIGSTAGTFNYNSVTAAGVPLAAGTQNVSVSLNGGATINLGSVASSATVATDVANLNAAFQGNATTRAAGLIATANAAGTKLIVSTTAGSAENFRLQMSGSATDDFGFGVPGSGAAAVTAGTGVSSYAAKDTVNSAGAQSSNNSASNTDVYAFTGLRNVGDAQTVTVSAVDANGTAHSLNVALTTANAGTLDQAVGTINQAILASNDSTLEQVGAVKEQGTTAGTPVSGAEGIRFLSGGDAFKVSLGASAMSANGTTSVGLADGGTGLSGGSVLSSSVAGTGGTADISNISTATAAVNQLAASVQTLGDAQAAVGQGENSMNYAINLANSQLTNLASAESDIRDANMASESANLTKASIQLQAGIAALAQANSAPQDVLTLLQH